MEGCFNLALLYVAGPGVARDAAKAAALFEQACQGGVTQGCVELEKMSSK